jgi:glycosyltransferase involved in cell wall biosynthesis
MTRKKNSIAIFILTYNEERHIARILKNSMELTDNIYVIDSFSDDNTRSIALNFISPEKFIQNKFLGYSSQVNFAIDYLKKYDFVLRLDADEYLSSGLIAEIKLVLEQNETFDGYYLRRYNVFCGKIIRWGGIYPVKILRLFNPKKAYSVDRPMDEYILINSKAGTLKNVFYDENVNGLSLWLQKHIKYAELEQRAHNWKKDAPTHHKQGQKFFYYTLPIFWRAIAYFLFRYLICLGFLDGWRGFAFHFLQSCWYRLVVDIRIKNNE